MGFNDEGLQGSGLAGDSMLRRGAPQASRTSRGSASCLHRCLPAQGPLPCTALLTAGGLLPERGVTGKLDGEATSPGDDLLPLFADRHRLITAVTSCPQCQSERNWATWAPAEGAAPAWHCPGRGLLQQQKNLSVSGNFPSLSCSANSEPPSASGDLTA